MLEEKRANLESEKKKALLRRLVEELSQADPDLYYRPTSAIAASILGYLKEGSGLINEERALLEGLSQRDVEVLLSLR